MNKGKTRGWLIYHGQPARMMFYKEEFQKTAIREDRLGNEKEGSGQARL